MRSVVIPVCGALCLALTACVPAGEPEPEQIAAELSATIEPEWETEVPGIYGEPAVGDGVVLAYALDEELGLRLTAHDTSSGELLWEHAAAPGGAYSNPLLLSKDGALRTYPIPSIAPFVAERKTADDESQTVVVFFEYVAPDDWRIEDYDRLRVADVRTGELLTITMVDDDPDDDYYQPLGITGDDDVYTIADAPLERCGDDVCWISTDADAFDGYSRVVLELDELEVRYEGGYIPDIRLIDPERGGGYVEFDVDDEEYLAHVDDGAEQWRIAFTELFDDRRTAPPSGVGIIEVGDLVLVQGYQPLLETLAAGQPHTLSIDLVDSRTLAALDRETGELRWRVDGADLLCQVVRDRPIPADATQVPGCLATGGGFVWDIEAERYLENADVAGSVVAFDLADGDIVWETEDAGRVSLAHAIRLLDTVYASRGELAVDERETPGLIDLRDGAWYPAPDDAAFVCRAEREDVDPQIDRPPLSGGLQGTLTTGYPAGWYHFACNVDGEEIESWSRGAVRLAGYADPDEPARRILTTADGLIGFRLG